MANERSSREAATRENTSRSKSWAPPSVLPEVPNVPGWEHRWVRTSTLGAGDPTNVSVRLREGWQPVPASEMEALMIQSDANSTFKDNIEVGGLLLCRMPSEDAKARNDYYEKQAKSQLAAVDNNYMRDNDPRMPKLKPERSTRITFGSTPR